MENKKDIINLTWEQKFEALKSICRDAHLTKNVNEQWRVVMPKLRTYHLLPEDYVRLFTGDTPEAAVENTWLELAYNPSNGFPEGRGVMPAQQNRVIIVVRCGKKDWEFWVKWNGFMWNVDLTQPVHF